MTIVMCVTHKGHKIIEDREPKIEENRKKSLFLKGRKTSQQLNQFAVELAKFRYGEIVHYSRTNDCLPFESVEPIEKFCSQRDCSLFAFFSHNKGHPNSITFGRLFNSQVMEMYEVGLLNFKSQPDLPSAVNLDHAAIPALLFEGDEWEGEYLQFRSLLIDFFVGDLKGHIDLYQIQHCLIFTATASTILVRHYSCDLSTTDPVLVQISPSFDWILRRTMLPSDDTMRLALQKPFSDRKKKNVTEDDLGRKLGRVFVGHQQTANLKLKRFRGLHHNKS
jgi:ribosome production factor 2